MQNEITGNSVRKDPRSGYQKTLDYKPEEILGESVGMDIVAWHEKAMLEWKAFSLRRQITSSSCGGQAGASALEEFIGEICSATPIYRERSNFPEEGMYMQEIGSILKNKFTTKESLCSSQLMTEIQMNNAKIPANLPYGIAGYYFLDLHKNFDPDVAAYALEMGHALVWLIDSSANEWQEVPKVGISPVTFSHFVATANKSNYLLYKGERSFVVSDSSNSFSTIKKPDGSPSGQRILTESYIRTRCFGVLVLIPEAPLPEYNHTFRAGVTLRQGDKGEDVLAWQNILAREGFLNKVFVIGEFGARTFQATKDLQAKYASVILTPLGLKAPTGVVAAATLSWANFKYSAIKK